MLQVRALKRVNVILSGIRNSLSALGGGVSYVNLQTGCAAYEQGTNEFLSAMSRIIQVFLVTSQFLRLAEIRGFHRVCVQLAPWVASPIILSAAMIETGFLKKITPQLNGKTGFFTNKIVKPLSEIESPTIHRIASSINRHTLTMVRVGMVVASTALIVFGDPLEGAILLSFVVYELIDAYSNLIPGSLRLIVETRLGHVASVGLLLSPSWVVRSYGVISLESFRAFVYFEKFLRYCFNMREGFSWSDVETPLAQRKNLNAQTVTAILNNPLFDPGALSELDLQELNLQPFTIVEQILENQHTTSYKTSAPFNFKPDYTHRSKDFSRKPYGEDFDFKYLQTLFNSIDWDNKYSNVFRKCKTDERFQYHLLDMLQLSHPQLTRHDIEMNCDGYLDQIKDKQAFVLKWFREQMDLFIRTACKEISPIGSQYDLEVAIRLLSQVVAHLKSLNMNDHQVEIEDCLLSLGVEGGRYCSSGLLRVVRERVESIRASDKPPDYLTTQAFEDLLYSTLQEIRLQSMHNLRDRALQNRVFNGDIHFAEEFEEQVSLGFYPTSTKLPFVVYALWFYKDWELTYKAHALSSEASEDFFRKIVEDFKNNPLDLTRIQLLYRRELSWALQHQYSVTFDQSLNSEIGDLHFADYVRHMIQKIAISKEEKELLTEKLSRTDIEPTELPGRLSQIVSAIQNNSHLRLTQQRYLIDKYVVNLAANTRHLAYEMLGVLRFSPASK